MADKKTETKDTAKEPKRNERWIARMPTKGGRPVDQIAEAQGDDAIAELWRILYPQ